MQKLGVGSVMVLVSVECSIRPPRIRAYSLAGSEHLSDALRHFADAVDALTRCKVLWNTNEHAFSPPLKSTFISLEWSQLQDN